MGQKLCSFRVLLLSLAFSGGIKCLEDLQREKSHVNVLFLSVTQYKSGRGVKKKKVAFFERLAEWFLQEWKALQHPSRQENY